MKMQPQFNHRIKPFDVLSGQWILAGGSRILSPFFAIYLTRFQIYRYINCNAFGTASRGLAINLHKALEAEHPALKLAQYRHLWVDLSHMMQQLGMKSDRSYLAERVLLC